MLHPPAVFLPISDQGQYCNAFLAYAFYLSKATAKLRIKSNLAKFFLHMRVGVAP